MRPAGSTRNPGGSTTSDRSKLGPILTTTGTLESAASPSRIVYGPIKYERLAALKRQHEPGNLFRFNHDVRR